MIKIEVGKLYNYKRPNWDGSIQCKAVDKNGELGLGDFTMIRFQLW